MTKIIDYLKPQPQEALVRLRNSSIVLLTTLVLIYLLDIEILFVGRCWRRSFGSEKGSVGWLLWGVSFTELILLGGISLNIFQSIYAIKYPSTPAPPAASPARKLNFTPSGTNNKSPRRLSGVSPKSSPQPQKPFPFTSSLSSSIYPPTPLSTPSRTLNYSYPASSSLLFDESLGSSGRMSAGLSGAGWSPSKSPLIEYKGRRNGRAMNGSLLMHLASQDSDDEEW